MNISLLLHSMIFGLCKMAPRENWVNKYGMAMLGCGFVNYRIRKVEVEETQFQHEFLHSRARDLRD